MPPRFRICPQCHHLLKHQPSPHRSLATAASASAITPAAPIFQATTSPPPIARYPRTQPPSHKPPEFRKSQLHRQYTSLLLSTPLFLLFQHNNLKAIEWMAVRRELKSALEKVDAELSTALAPAIKLEAIQVSIFESAFLVAEYYDRDQYQHRSTSRPPSHPTDPSTPSSATKSANHTPNNSNNAADPALTHYLSRTAHHAVSRYKKYHSLRPLLSGPLATLSFPLVTPHHLRAALTILSPKAPRFPAPTRRASPSYHDPHVQQGVQKLMLLGARVEGRVFDHEGARWVGGIEGGLDGLRGVLVGVLGEVGGRALTGALEGVGRSLWVAVEGRRGMLEEEEKEKEKEKGRSGGE